MTRARVDLWAVGSAAGGRNRANVYSAIIDDAKNIGTMARANGAGEMFFTIPYNHPVISEIKPFQRHYRITRLQGSDDANPVNQVVVATGMVLDVDDTEDEAIVYGTDYMGMLNFSITASSTTYTNTALSTIVLNELTAAINATDSPLGFTTAITGSGDIETTSRTSTLVTAYEPRLGFLAGVAEVSMASTTEAAILRLSEGQSLPHWQYITNVTTTTDLRLEYGGMVNHFEMTGLYSEFATRIDAVGVKRDGAAVIYATGTVTSSPTSTWGLIERAKLYTNVVNAAALSAMAQRDARRASTPGRAIRVVLRATPDVVPSMNGRDYIGGFARVIIQRSHVSFNAMCRIWGQRWLCDAQGRESLYFEVEIPPGTFA